MINKNLKVIYYLSSCFLIFCLVFSNLSNIDADETPPAIEENEEYLIYNKIEIILTQPLKDEGCWNCHQDRYPNRALNPNSPEAPNLSCFMDPNGRPYPIDYSSSDNTSGNFATDEYNQKREGHLSHLVYQPFGLGRLCLDCHDPNCSRGDPNHPSYKNVYFHDGEKLDFTTICKECHGGFYPEDNKDPNIDNKLKVLQWGDHGSVTCIQCHDDSSENGGIYATYENRYFEYFNDFDDDPNITAPDPDKVPRQNYWSKSGHGIIAEKSYAGATLDTGYPDPNRKNRTYPNKGAMNSKNIPYDPSDPNNKHSQSHDLNLDPNDGRKNFCWECHWSNKIVRKTVCIDTRVTDLFPKYPEGFPIGKYNGHLDEMRYRDERWGPVERAYQETCSGHKQWSPCRECHPTKYSHFGYPLAVEYQTRQRRSSTIERYSHCVICHNPHGSGDKQGNANVFMIKRRIYNESPCYNCHGSQFRSDSDSPDPNTYTWIVNFFDPLRQDIREPDSPENSISIPASTTDICEVCHQDKAMEYWPNPNPIDPNGVDYRHRNGSRHYFNPNFDPNNDTCSDPNTCTIDYRGTDCTGCHIHDPDPPLPLPPYTPDEQQKIGDPLGLYPFNSKAFAPTCRCHGIGRIDIATLSYETYWGDGNKPIIAGKGHGTPPPPFPIVNPNDPVKDPNQDVHMAHARYNFPCFRCHIDPDDPPYDPNTGYIFDLDGNTPIGFDQFMNPNGRIYEDNDLKTCSNLYCHSNGKGIYADPIIWSKTDNDIEFCRDTNNISCKDPNDLRRFTYCDNCHKTPPDDTGTDHYNTSSECDECHPHKGIYEGKGEFYLHVNQTVETGNIIQTFDPNGPTCGSCHKDANVPEWGELHSKIDKDEVSCDVCHIDHQDPNSLHAYRYDPNKCKYCHDFSKDNEITIECDGKNITGEHSVQATKCNSCHPGVYVIDEPLINDLPHYKDPNSLNIMDQNWIDSDGIAGNECSICHVSSSEEDIHNRCNSSCEDCHGDHCDMDYCEDNKCKCCHPASTFSLTSDYGCNREIHQLKHEADAYNDNDNGCTSCHANECQSENHLDKKTDISNMPIDDWPTCELCHKNPLSHGNDISDCQNCHKGNHCKMDIGQTWGGEGTCGECHRDVLLPNGQPLHAGLLSGVSCLECHPSHRDADSLRRYLDDTSKCGYCHISPIQINVLCSGIAVNGAHPPWATNCQACHPGVYNKTSKHYLDAGPLNVIKSWVGENSCGVCHVDAPVVPCGVGPPSIHGALGPISDCALCHGNHCDMIYGDTPVKCIACHGPNPEICDICGPGSFTTHYAFDSLGINQAAIQNCISCHVEPLAGGEANPRNHINDPKTYVNPSACLGCHSVTLVRHGEPGLPWPGGVINVNCYSCHPTHCVSTFSNNQACIWCHTAAPLLENVCGKPGLVPHSGDCIGCHAAGSPTGGECNPADHFNGLVYVRNGTCLSCHANIIATHEPGTEACMLCHPVHCGFTYCSEPQCKLCHNRNEFQIISEYGCGIGLHDPPAYKECNRCHIGECNPNNHRLRTPDEFEKLTNPAYKTSILTDLTGMRLEWGDCGLCHYEHMWYHSNCKAPCNQCHFGGNGIHVCTDLNYCSENQCKCCHVSQSFKIENPSCRKPGKPPRPDLLHDIPAYIDCTICHIRECNTDIHLDQIADVSNMPIQWDTCGLCHRQAQKDHFPCEQPCTACHSGTGPHLCQDLNYCSESKCKCCHAVNEFEIRSDYGCGIGKHASAAYINCTLCHVEECDPFKHKDETTDVSNMPLEWGTCGLCHVEAKEIHKDCPEPCTLCHSGKGNHSCLELDYCTETRCKCCHIDDSFFFDSDYGCGTNLLHPPPAYVDCTMCHIGECDPQNHLDIARLTDLSNMPPTWDACGVCHADDKAIHLGCTRPCTLCHTGQGNHPCQGLEYCDETEKCQCCHTPELLTTINSDYGCGTGPHAPAAYVNCTMCHGGECLEGNHRDTQTDVSNMPLEWSACRLCHADEQESHAGCPDTCTLCHSGTSPHACLELDYCEDQKCRCCHVNPALNKNVPYHPHPNIPNSTTECDCATCHSAECDPLEHDITGVLTNHPMNPLYYNYTGTINDKGCTCCHPYPPQCVCVGESDTQDHCLDLANGCDPQIYDCMVCHKLFNGQQDHISIVYGTPAEIASCACHGDALGTTGAHAKHLTTPVMVPVYGTGSGNVIDCKACHSSTTDLADHVVCFPGPGVFVPVQFDAVLPMIGLIDSYTPGATPGTGSCNLYCHSDGNVAPLDGPGTYTYFPPLTGVPPFWNQTTGIISCGNNTLGTTTEPVYQCHGYPPPPPGHPGPAGGGGGGGGGGAGGGGGGGVPGAGIQNCTNCHPTPILGSAPDITVHINGETNITGGGGFGGGGGVGGLMPVT